MPARLEHFDRSTPQVVLDARALALDVLGPSLIGLWEPADPTSMFADTAGTTPAALGGNVARINPTLGSLTLTQSNSGFRAARQEAGGRSNLTFDLADDLYVTPNLATAITNGTVIAFGRSGCWFETVNIAAGSPLNIGGAQINANASGVGGRPLNGVGGQNAGILAVIGPLVGLALINRQLTVAEQALLVRYGVSLGCPGRLVEGTSIVSNGTFGSNVNGWGNAPGEVNGGFVWEAPGRAALTTPLGHRSFIRQTVTAVPGAAYLIRGAIDRGAANTNLDLTAIDVRDGATVYQTYFAAYNVTSPWPRAFRAATNSIHYQMYAHSLGAGTQFTSRWDDLQLIPLNLLQVPT